MRARLDALRANRALLWACIVIAVNQLGFGIVVPVTPIYARSFGVTETAVGFVFAIYGLGRLLFNVPAGNAADRYGRRPTILVGTIVTSAGSLLCGLAEGFTQLLFFRLIGGIGAAIVITGVQTVVADIATRENRSRMMATYQAFFTFAVGVGPSVGGVVALWAGYRAPFFAFAGLALAAGVLAIAQLPESRPVARASGPAGPLAPSGATRALLVNVGFLTLSAITFVQFFNRTGGIFAVVPLAGVERIGIDPVTMGLALTAASVCNIAFVGVAGSLADRHGRKAAIVPGCVVGAASFWGFSFATDYPLFVLSAILWGLSGAFLAASAAYTADLAPAGAVGLTMGVYRTLADLGYVIGHITLGYLAETMGSAASLSSAAWLSLLTMVPFLLFAPETGGTHGRARRA